MGYLGALQGGHVVLLTPRGDTAEVAGLVDTFDPDVVVGAAGTVHPRRPGTRHDLHPDLAVLLTTSGSTGTPRLVRLSAEAVDANAAAIADYLGIAADDRPTLTLPMHYCYCLSVINSNLLRGAGLLLGSRSVTDPEFWTAFRDHRGTSLHGVPYTFDLLEAVGFADMSLPHLRQVTQAGGRLAPERVSHSADVGRRQGWELVVMYGQTEATARMAYLPPHLALVQILRCAAVAFAVPAVRRLERRHPFGLPATVLALAQLLRLLPGSTAITPDLYSTHLVLWLFALGWTAYRARTSLQLVATTLATLVLLPTFFGTEIERAVLVASGLLVLLLVPRVHLPRALAEPVTACASASLAIYLTHFALLPLRAHGVPAAVLVPVALALGVAAWWVVNGVLRRVAVAVRRRRAVPATQAPHARRDQAVVGV